MLNLRIKHLWQWKSRTIHKSLCYLPDLWIDSKYRCIVLHRGCKSQNNHFEEIFRKYTTKFTVTHFQFNVLVSSVDSGFEPGINPLFDMNRAFVWAYIWGAMLCSAYVYVYYHCFTKLVLALHFYFYQACPPHIAV